jgi:hypothetical protein
MAMRALSGCIVLLWFVRIQDLSFIPGPIMAGGNTRDSVHPLLILSPLFAQQLTKAASPSALVEKGFPGIFEKVLPKGGKLQPVSSSDIRVLGQ